MEPQNNVQNEEQYIKTASKLLAIELISIFTILVIALLTLNYYNILSLSQIFPTQLGWLPQRGNKNKVSEELVSRNKQRVDLNQTPEERAIVSYIKEVMNPEFIPPDSDLEDIRLKEVMNPEFIPPDSDLEDIRQYAANNLNYFSGLVKRIDYTLYFSYAETPEGKPSDVGVALSIFKDQPQFSPEGLRDILPKYFISVPQEIDLSKVKMFSLPGGDLVIEFVWTNTDGDKESRFLQRSTFETTEEVLIGACEIYKESPLFLKNSCFFKNNE